MAVKDAPTKRTMKVTGKELDSVMAKAIKKVGGSKENDLCRYIPMDSGGYMHHFTLRKMKNNTPTELATLIEQYIIEPERPRTVAPKKRAKRGSRKRRNQVTLDSEDLERILNMARLSGDHEMVRKLTPKRSLSQTKRELIRSIRQGKLDDELWKAYSEAVQSQAAELEMAAADGSNNGTTIL